MLSPHLLKWKTQTQTCGMSKHVENNLKGTKLYDQNGFLCMDFFMYLFCSSCCKVLKNAQMILSIRNFSESSSGKPNIHRISDNRYHRPQNLFQYLKHLINVIIAHNMSTTYLRQLVDLQIQLCDLSIGSKLQSSEINNMQLICADGTKVIFYCWIKTQMAGQQE